jgi:hypothetical protein
MPQHHMLARQRSKGVSESRGIATEKRSGAPCVSGLILSKKCQITVHRDLLLYDNTITTTEDINFF